MDFHNTVGFPQILCLEAAGGIKPEWSAPVTL
jgi:hypothetical protein